MKATEFEFRYRLWIGTAIYLFGFWAPWMRYGGIEGSATTTWLELSGQLGQLVPLEAATIVVTSAAILLAVAGTVFRLWGTAYIGGSVVKSNVLHAHAVVAAGPYRHLRNPLYLGSFLYVGAMAILMPPSGAVFALVASYVQIIRLILREEPYMEAQQGDAYIVYKNRVRRLFPSTAPRMPESAAQPQWPQAFVAEIFYVAMTLCFTLLAWRYNANLLIQALLICFGLSLVVRAFTQKKPLEGKRGDGPQPSPSP
jgi:protein-S-isoprenylcysteine O-methyltransferase Ste14